MVWCHTWYRGRYRESKMATSGDSSPLNQLLGRIMQTIRSVQRSVDGGVDSNILQRNISIIEAVQIQLVRIETLFSVHESRVLYDQLQTEVLIMSRQNLSDTRHNHFWREVLFLLKLKSLLPRLYSDLLGEVDSSDMLRSRETCTR